MELKENVLWRHRLMSEYYEDNPWWNWKVIHIYPIQDVDEAMIILDGIESSYEKFSFKVGDEEVIILDGIERWIIKPVTKCDYSIW